MRNHSLTDYALSDERSQRTAGIGAVYNFATGIFDMQLNIFLLAPIFLILNEKEKGSTQ